ncbi:MAG: cell division protein FtsA [Paludibacter sp.]|nr:cell division protein FtsA [Paludibacter sp.]
MNSTKLIAIDFGSSKISVMAGEVLDSGEIRILSEESKVSDDVKWGIVDKPTGASYKVSELLKLLKNSARIPEITQVSVCLGAKSMKHKTHTISRFVGKSNIVTDDLLADMLNECEKSIQRENIDVLDVIPISYILDGNRQDEPVGKKAVQITANYNIILGHSIIKKELERCFDRTGIIMGYSPLAIEAISTVVLEDHEREAGCAIINFGATTTTLGVYNDGILQHLLVVPLGAKNITKDIQELGISEEHAEKLKCLKGYALERLVENPMYVQIPSENESGVPVRISTKFLSTIIEARLEEILQPIFDVISNLEFTLEEGIIITGGGSKLNNLIEFIEERTGINPRFGDHSDWLSNDTNNKYGDPIFAQLVGTIILTDEYIKQHPEEIAIEQPKKKAKIPGKGLGEKLTNRIFDFFSEETKL